MSKLSTILKEKSETDGSFIHNINVYPAVQVIYKDVIQGTYEFTDLGKKVSIKACMDKKYATLTDAAVESHLADVSFIGLDLKQRAYEEFVSEKFILDPSKIALSDISIKTNKAWEYWNEEEMEKAKAKLEKEETKK